MTSNVFTTRPKKLTITVTLFFFSGPLKGAKLGKYESRVLTHLVTAGFSQDGLNTSLY